MKKKIIILIIFILLIIGGISYFIFFNEEKPASIITLDINPSVEIHLNEENKVIRVKALNSDAKELVNDELIGKDYNYAITNIIDKVVEVKNLKNDRIGVILNVNGTIDKSEVINKINEYSADNNLDIPLYIVDTITEEDKALAKKLGVTEGKANYLNSIQQEYNDINVEELKERDVSELMQTKETGKTCPPDYQLDGDNCKKEISRTKADYSKVCPEGYTEYNDKCYLEGERKEIDTLTCLDDFKLNGNKCERDVMMPLEGKCSKGDFDDAKLQCRYSEPTGEATLYCRITPSADLLYNKRCLGRKPMINGGCLGSDKVINGWCYDTSANSGYEAEYRCPDGMLISIKDYESGLKCTKEVWLEAESIYCPDGFNRVDNKCIRHEIEDPFHDITCESGFTKTKDIRCLNLNNTNEMIDGYKCHSPNSRLEGDTCINYEVVSAK